MLQPSMFEEVVMHTEKENRYQALLPANWMNKQQREAVSRGWRAVFSFTMNEFIEIPNDSKQLGGDCATGISVNGMTSTREMSAKSL